MTDIPDAAIEAASEAFARKRNPRHDALGYSETLAIRAAIEAAMPAIRESIAQEIEDYDEPLSFVDAFTEAARVVRGAQ